MSRQDMEEDRANSLGGFFLFILTGLNFQCFAISCGLLDRKQEGEAALHSVELAVRHYTLSEDMGAMVVPGHPRERGEKSGETSLSGVL